MRMAGLLGDGSVAIGGKWQPGLSDRDGSVALEVGLKLSYGMASGGDIRLAMDGSLVMVTSGVDENDDEGGEEEEEEDDDDDRKRGGGCEQQREMKVCDVLIMR